MSSHLQEQLEQGPLLLVDGLYAFDFELNEGEPALLIHCMDGSKRCSWQFSQEQLKQAQWREASQDWLIGEHSLQCLGAVSSDDEDDLDDDQEDQAFIDQP